MKKTIIALMGLFTLVACSDEAYLNSTDPNSNFGDTSVPSNPGDKRANTFDSSNPGWINWGSGPFINPGSGYQSPWDVWFRNTPFTPNYAFLNDEGVAGHSSILVMRVTPWVGLAYYDGVNDGRYRDIAQPGSPIVGNFVLNPALYPNLYVGGKEIGNLVRGKSFELNGTTMDEISLEIASDPASSNPEHLLSTAGTLNPMGYNPRNIRFEFPSATAQERTLLAQYGKVFYFEVDIWERATGAPVGAGKYFLQLENETLDASAPSPHWVNTGLTASIPGMGTTRAVHYYYDTTTPGALNETQWQDPYPIVAPTIPSLSYFCNSREVVIKKAYPSKYTIPYSSGAPWELRVDMMIGSHLWRTSGPALTLRR